MTYSELDFDRDGPLRNTYAAGDQTVREVAPGEEARQTAPRGPGAGGGECRDLHLLERTDDRTDNRTDDRADGLGPRAW